MPSLATRLSRMRRICRRVLCCATGGVDSARSGGRGAGKQVSGNPIAQCWPQVGYFGGAVLLGGVGVTTAWPGARQGPRTERLGAASILSYFSDENVLTSRPPGVTSVSSWACDESDAQGSERGAPTQPAAAAAAAARSRSRQRVGDWRACPRSPCPASCPWHAAGAAQRSWSRPTPAREAPLVSAQPMRSAACATCCSVASAVRAPARDVHPARRRSRDPAAPRVARRLPPGAQAVRCPPAPAGPRRGGPRRRRGT